MARGGAPLSPTILNGKFYPNKLYISLEREFNSEKDSFLNTGKVLDLATL